MSIGSMSQCIVKYSLSLEILLEISKALESFGFPACDFWPKHAPTPKSTPHPPS